MRPFPFSRKKTKVDTLMVVEKAIALELVTFTNHLQTVQMSYENIIKLLEENKKEWTKRLGTEESAKS